MRKTVTLFCLFSVFAAIAQPAHDSITRRPPLRGLFRWIVSADLYEEGNIINNLKHGEWNKYYQGKFSGKTVYKDGLAIAEYWIYHDTLKPRYELSSGADTMNIYDYDFAGRVKSVTKYSVNPKTIFLNYSLMTEDTIFKKEKVTEIKYDYELWAHRNDIVVVTELTGGVPNTKFFNVASGKWNLLWEKNDKGDFISGKKKEFLKEESRSRKLLEEKNKGGSK